MGMSEANFQIKLTPNLRGYPPEKKKSKVFVRALFLMSPPTNYVSVEFDKIMFHFDFCFRKAAEAFKSKITGWHSRELMGYEDLMIFSVIWPDYFPIDKEQNGVREFFYFKCFSSSGL